MKDEMIKEERLAMMEMSRKEWETGYICKYIVKDILKEMTGKETDDQELKDMRIESILKEIEECGLQGTIIMEMEKRKSCVNITRSNRPSNEPGVVRGQSNGSSSSTSVMD